MMNGTLQDFAAAVSANGQIRYGDVRRLQRDILPNGIFSREEAELLIALNARLVRADKAWAQWLVAAVVEFAANQAGREHPLEEALGDLIGRLVTASSTRFGRGIAHKLRRALESQYNAQATEAETSRPQTTASRDRAWPRRVRAVDAKRDKRSPRRSKARCAAQPKMIRDATPLAAAGFGWVVPGYLPAIRHGRVMNFPSAPVGLVLALCR